MFQVKVGPGCLQVTQDDQIITVQRFCGTDELDTQLEAVDRALEALRAAVSEVIRSSWRHHHVQRNLALTDGFHR